jgi:flagellar hook-basal body complex protein FliE
MNVQVLVPDGPAAPTRSANPGRADAFGALVAAAGAQLDRADTAEAAFANGHGGMQEMVVERARADIALQVAATAAQRTAQALTTLLGMQI